MAQVEEPMPAATQARDEEETRALVEAMEAHVLALEDFFAHTTDVVFDAWMCKTYVRVYVHVFVYVYVYMNVYMHAHEAVYMCRRNVCVCICVCVCVRVRVCVCACT